MEIKYLEWNLHAMGGEGYEIPQFICEYINKTDVLVLVEFCLGSGWDRFKNAMKEFDLYCSPFVSKGYNQVCIGIRKTINYKLLSVISKDVCDANIPELLQVDIEIAEKKVRLLGTRIRTQTGTKFQQFEYLKGYLKKFDIFLCLGDFNAVNKTLSNVFSSVASVYGPRILNGYHSFVHKNSDTCGLDWVLSKGITDVYNGYLDAKDSPYATYDWSFVNSVNGYGNKTQNDYLGIVGLPDHAILKGMIKI